MTATERVLAHFDRISEAPDAISRLRRFVLDLAVRGKLVDQDPSDEPGASLIERIRAEKTRTTPPLGGANARTKGRASSLSDPDNEAEPFAVPATWHWSSLSQVGHISPRNVASDADPASFVPMTLISADYGTPSQHEPRPWGEIRNGYTHFANGDVALAKITPCFENGKSTVFRSLTGGIGAGTTELHVVRPILMDPDYILIFLKSPSFSERGIPKMTGTAGQKRVPADYFALSPFPVPPLAEQHRIVAKVDKLMALCDRLETAQKKRESRRDRLVSASLARLNQPADEPSFREHARFHLEHLPRMTASRAQIQELRRTILNLAVSGRLSPSVESASTPRPRAGEVRAEIPSSWRHMRLADLLVEDTRNGYSRKPDETPDGTPILRISAGTIRPDGIVAEEEHKLISGVDSEVRVQFGLKRGDLLACRFNGNKSFVGRFAIFEDYLGIEPIYPDKLIRVRLAGSLAIPQYIRLAGDADLIRNQIEAACATTVGNWGISASNLKEIRFPVPSVAEQRRIVTKVHELMAVCDRLAAQLEGGQVTQRALLEATLHGVLTGPERAPMIAAE